eukprot:309698-Prymnesium_polylepis.2
MVRDPAGCQRVALRAELRLLGVHGSRPLLDDVEHAGERRRDGSEYAHRAVVLLLWRSRRRREAAQLGDLAIDRVDRRAVRLEDRLRFAVTPILDARRPYHAVHILFVMLDADQVGPHLLVGVQAREIPQVVRHDEDGEGNALGLQLRLHVRPDHLADLLAERELEQRE